MVEVIGIFGIILFGLLTIGYGASCRGKTCLWKERTVLERHGHKGETSMSELKVIDVDKMADVRSLSGRFYRKSEVDKVIAEKDAKILSLEAAVFKQKHHAELLLDERNYAETQLRHSNNKLKEQESLIKEMKEAAADMGFKWHDYDAGEDAWEDEHKGRWVRVN